MSWEGNEGVISLTTVDERKGCCSGIFIVSVCVCVWLFGGEKVSAN